MAQITNDQISESLIKCISHGPSGITAYEFCGNFKSKIFLGDYYVAPYPNKAYHMVLEKPDSSTSVLQYEFVENDKPNLPIVAQIDSVNGLSWGLPPYRSKLYVRSILDPFPGESNNLGFLSDTAFISEDDWFKNFLDVYADSTHNRLILISAGKINIYKYNVGPSITLPKNNVKKYRGKRDLIIKQFHSEIQIFLKDEYISSVEIYSLCGQSLKKNIFKNVNGKVVWDKKDNSGKVLTSGCYCLVARTIDKNIYTKNLTFSR